MWQLPLTFAEIFNSFNCSFCFRTLIQPIHLYSLCFYLAWLSRQCNYTKLPYINGFRGKSFISVATIVDLSKLKKMRSSMKMKMKMLFLPQQLFSANNSTSISTFKFKVDDNWQGRLNKMHFLQRYFSFQTT